MKPIKSIIVGMPETRSLRFVLLFCGVLLVAALLQPLPGYAQSKITWTDQEKPIVSQLQGLRGLSDDQRIGATKQLALQIRALPAGDHKVTLASALASLSTEGDFGRDTLQEVTTTLEQALRENPVSGKGSEPAHPYMELASLVRYEHMRASLDDPQFTAAMSKLEAEDQKRQQADFTLQDLQGKNWSMKDLHGKVVVVNFWATWCPPCRKEIPSLEQLYTHFKDKGLVILAISDEDLVKVQPFISKANVDFTVLLDPGRKVHQLFGVDGIPKTFVYNREGKLAAQSIDMRTEKQFLEMLGTAGIQ
jgi:peroxiredoxin